MMVYVILAISSIILVMGKLAVETQVFWRRDWLKFTFNEEYGATISLVVSNESRPLSLVWTQGKPSIIITFTRDLLNLFVGRFIVGFGKHNIKLTRGNVGNEERYLLKYLRRVHPSFHILLKHLLMTTLKSASHRIPSLFKPAFRNLPDPLSLIIASPLDLFNPQIIAEMSEEGVLAQDARYVQINDGFPDTIEIVRARRAISLRIILKSQRSIPKLAVTSF